MALNTEAEPLVTCVLNCFSSASTLPEALRSILAQNHKNLEVVAVNNASVDETAAILQHYSAADARLTVLTNPQWIHPYESWRRGINASSGDFIFLANDDDVWDPNFVRTLVRGLITTGGALAFCDVETFGTDANHRRAHHYASAANQHRFVLEDSAAGRRARLKVIVSKYLGPEKIAPNLFYSLYPAEPLRRISHRPLIWTEYGFIDERYIWAPHSYQGPWYFADETLLRRRVGNGRPPLDPAMVAPKLDTRSIPRMEVRKVIFLRRLLSHPSTPLRDRLLVVLPLLLGQALDAFVRPRVQAVKQSVLRLVRRTKHLDAREAD